MRRSTFWLWLSGGVLGGATIAIFGGWWAMRQWPEEVGPRLPPSLAYGFSDWGPQEASAAHSCFGDFSEYWWNHEMTPAMAAARNAVLCAELRGTRAQQLAVLDFIINGSNIGFVTASPERDALVYALTSSNDPELRDKARDCWRRDSPRTLIILRWTLSPDADDRSRLSPDGWVIDQTGADAVQLLTLHNWRYDHKSANRYQEHLKGLLGRLIAIDQQALMAKDPRTHALVLLAITEAFSLTHDPDLKPIVDHGLATMRNDPDRLERLWMEDTTTAVLTATIPYLALVGGIDTGDVRQRLRAGLDAWMTTADTSGLPRWCRRGEPVPATDLERWAAWAVSLHYLQRNPDTPTTPPVGLTDPQGSTPFGRYLIRQATSIHSLSGLSAWLQVFDQRSDVLVERRAITPDHQLPEGTWPATATVSNRWETAFTLLELSIERYRPPPRWAP